eukprot:385680_1
MAYERRLQMAGMCYDHDNDVPDDEDVPPDEDVPNDEDVPEESKADVQEIAITLSLDTDNAIARGWHQTIHDFLSSIDPQWMIRADPVMIDCNIEFAGGGFDDNERTMLLTSEKINSLVVHNTTGMVRNNNTIIEVENRGGGTVNIAQNAINAWMGISHNKIEEDEESKPPMCIEDLKIFYKSFTNEKRNQYWWYQCFPIKNESQSNIQALQKVGSDKCCLCWNKIKIGHWTLRPDCGCAIHMYCLHEWWLLNQWPMICP